MMKKKVINPNKPFSRGMLIIWAEELALSANRETFSFKPSCTIYGWGKCSCFFKILK